jgi:hypothetical protein
MHTVFPHSTRTGTGQAVHPWKGVSGTLHAQRRGGPTSAL